MFDKSKFKDLVEEYEDSTKKAQDEVIKKIKDALPPRTCVELYNGDMCVIIDYKGNIIYIWKKGPGPSTLNTMEFIDDIVSVNGRLDEKWFDNYFMF